jgi:hypothetical protein
MSRLEGFIGKTVFGIAYWTMFIKHMVKGASTRAQAASIYRERLKMYNACHWCGELFPDADERHLTKVSFGNDIYIVCSSCLREFFDEVRRLGS